jgi:protein-S-isoprenylcysteine O-methyltransferase Ste14
MKNTVYLFLIILSCLSLTSCFHYATVAKDTMPAVNDKGDQQDTMVVSAYFWGAVSHPVYTQPYCDGQGFNKVEVKYTFWQGLAGLITIGIWRPATIITSCTKDMQNE